jgi:hypothetical protein
MTNLGIMERARKLLNAASLRASKQEAKNRRVTGATNSKRSNNTARSNPPPIWMETEARVTECHYELPRLRTLDLRVSKDTDNVIVSFTYYAHAQIYYDEFRSQVKKAQGEAFSVYYNALNPRQNAFLPSMSTNRRALSNTAILGFILLSVLFLVMVRG